jgi:UDP-N-acetylmuramoyl-L-alanyl-D-glutamate--2,6-diaminopimelate ligase
VEPAVRTLEAALAAAVFRFPGRRLRIIGVTGTDGKTTTCHLILAMLEAGGSSSGIISTVSAPAVAESQRLGRELTTPNPWMLQRLLRAIVREGGQWAVLEATSHGLALQRLACVPVEVAVLTNVSRDHLDFHGGMDEYVTAKAKLFRRARVGVISRDTALVDRFERAGAQRWIYYGLDEGDVSAYELVTTPRASFLLDTPIGTSRVELPWPGVIQVKNALAAAAVGIGIDLPLDQIVRGLESAPSLSGRMEWVPNPFGDFRIIIDHAHTEEALVGLYAALRPLVRGRLIGVLGIDGDRDRGKRPLLGRVAGEMCDFVILTSTDPRTESPEKIVEQLRSGLEQAGRRADADYEIVIDRSQAILRSLELARDRDIVVLTGIGQQQYRSLAAGKVPWSERAAVEHALAKLGSDGWTDTERRSEV